MHSRQHPAAATHREPTSMACDAATATVVLTISGFTAQHCDTRTWG
jgi:hypothetical protein